MQHYFILKAFSGSKSSESEFDANNYLEKIKIFFYKYYQRKKLINIYKKYKENIEHKFKIKILN